MEAVTRAKAAAQSKYDKKPSAELHVELRHARTAVKVATEEAKVDWIDKQAVSMSDTLTNPRAVWDAVNKIKEGLGLRTKSQIPLMMKADKSISATVEESAEVFAKHFEVQPKWKTTAAMTEKWLTCSTWTLLAEDRGLWKEAVGTYLVAKYEQTDA